MTDDIATLVYEEGVFVFDDIVRTAMQMLELAKRGQLAQWAERKRHIDAMKAQHEALRLMHRRLVGLAP